MVPLLLLHHLGPMHPLEQVLVVLLAFGPFLLLALVVWLTRRRNARDSEQSEP